jgi:protein-S-isoprenylcysteine O-methyltransferase Ste14
MRRLLGIGFGVATQALFLATLLPVYRFLRNDWAAAPEGSLWIDAALALGFAIPHSILLHPSTRRSITGWLPSELYGCLFCLVTCSSLLVLLEFWRGSQTVLWAWPQTLQPAIRAAFLGCWAILFYSLSLTGLEYQTGVGPWWRWVRRQPVPRRQFLPRGAYRYLRHPAYLSFLGLVWLTPVVTADRAVLIAVWTTYVFVGSYLKDRRLAQVLGEPYVQYVSEVPAYPFLAWMPKPLRLLDLAAADRTTREEGSNANTPAKAA